MFSLISATKGLYPLFEDVYAVPAEVRNAFATTKVRDAAHVLSYRFSYPRVTLVASISYSNWVDASVGDDTLLIDVRYEAASRVEAIERVCRAMSLAAGVYTAIREGDVNLSAYSEIDVSEYSGVKYGFVTPDGFEVLVS